MDMEIVSTDRLDTGQRLLLWQQTVCSLYPETDLVEAEQDTFFGSIAWRRLGSVLLSDIRSCRQTQVRQRRNIKRSGAEILQINLQVEGTGQMAQDGRLAITRPGEIVIYDSSRPYQMSFDGPFRQFSIEFPRSDLKDRFGPTEAITAMTIDGVTGSGRFLRSFAQSLIEQPDAGDAALAERMHGHLVELLISALCALDLMPLSQGRFLTQLRAKALVTAQLKDPDLTPEPIACALGISLRYLHSLFSADGSSFGRFVLQQRLQAARKDIESPALRARPLSAIGLDWGFKDAGYFARAFRTHFGMTPGQCRAAALAALLRS